MASTGPLTMRTVAVPDPLLPDESVAVPVMVTTSDVESASTARK